MIDQHPSLFANPAARRELIVAQKQRPRPADPGWTMEVKRLFQQTLRKYTPVRQALAEAQQQPGYTDMLSGAGGLSLIGADSMYGGANGHRNNGGAEHA